MKQEVEAQAAEALLDKRLKVNLPAPWLFRIMGVKSVPIYVKRPTAGQLLQICALYVRMGIDLKEMEKGEAIPLFSEIAKHGKAISGIIALGLIRGVTTSFFFHRLLARYIRNHMDMLQMAELCKLIAYLAGAENFASIIRSIAYMRITMPTQTLSREENGS